MLKIPGKMWLAETVIEEKAMARAASARLRL
jgi:hypothetical protein